MNNREYFAKNGERFYSNGKKCKHGHAPLRYVSTGLCVHCVKINTKINREKIRDMRFKAKKRIKVITYAEYEQALYDYAESLNAAHELGL